MSRDEVKQIRDYLDHGGLVYDGLCRRGSYWIHALKLEEEFEGEDVRPR